VPEPLWWLLGAIVSFYFGACYQTKGQEFQRSIATTIARAPQVAETRPDAPLSLATLAPGDNPALEDWRKHHA
jgi:hypothetical protein